MCTGTEHTQGWYKCRYYISIGLCLVQQLSCTSYQMYQTNLTDGSQLSAHPEQKRKIRRKNGAGWSSRSCRSPVCGKKLRLCRRQTSDPLCRSIDHRRTHLHGRNESRADHLRSIAGIAPVAFHRERCALTSTENVLMQPYFVIQAPMQVRHKDLKDRLRMTCARMTCAVPLPL